MNNCEKKIERKGGGDKEEDQWLRGKKGRRKRAQIRGAVETTVIVSKFSE